MLLKDYDKFKQQIFADYNINLIYIRLEDWHKLESRER